MPKSCVTLLLSAAQKSASPAVQLCARCKNRILKRRRSVRNSWSSRIASSKVLGAPNFSAQHPRQLKSGNVSGVRRHSSHAIRFGALRAPSLNKRKSVSQRLFSFASNTEPLPTYVSYELLKHRFLRNLCSSLRLSTVSDQSSRLETKLRIRSFSWSCVSDLATGELRVLFVAGPLTAHSLPFSQPSSSTNSNPMCTLRAAPLFLVSHRFFFTCYCHLSLRCRITSHGSGCRLSGSSTL